jgi:hypothetical protein
MRSQKPVAAVPGRVAPKPDRALTNSLNGKKYYVTFDLNRDGKATALTPRPPVLLGLAHVNLRAFMIRLASAVMLLARRSTQALVEGLAMIQFRPMLGRQPGPRAVSRFDSRHRRRDWRADRGGSDADRRRAGELQGRQAAHPGNLGGLQDALHAGCADERVLADINRR